LIQPIRLAAGFLTAVAIMLLGEYLLGGDRTVGTEVAPGGVQSTASGQSPSGRKANPLGKIISPLAGTKWRLLSFQSMGDAIGQIRPEDPSLIAMNLRPDGTVSMRLCCNSAKGTYSVEPAGDRTSDRFEIGQLAYTRSSCPPFPPVERIVKDLKFVRGYLLREGLLNLSLMADGGIYSWEPYGDLAPLETDPDAAP
jgi:hypothetical protein